MPYENNTLGCLLGNSRIKEVAKEAIRNRDLEAESIKKEFTLLTGKR